MLKVMYKDFILNRRTLFINWAVFGSFFVYMAAQEHSSVQVFVVFVSLMCSFAGIGAMAREDAYKATALGCSLPVTRRTVVAARYASTAVLSAVGLAGATFLFLVLPFSQFTARELFTSGALLVVLTTVGLIMAFMLPFTIRFGMSGLLVFLVTTQVIGIVLFMAVQISGSSGDKRLARAVVQALRDAQGAMGTPLFELAGVLALALLLALSLGVSVLLFERREL
jgi:ABC-type transport system involved in multi-copper enzyme maturation permease subunit